MSSWLGGLWGTEATEVDLDEELAKLSYCTEEQKQLVLHVITAIHSAVRGGHPLFFSAEDQAKNLIRRCIWTCFHFRKEQNIVRASLEIILAGIRPSRTQLESGINYLHLVYTEILFEAFKPSTDSHSSNQSNMRVLLSLLSIPDFQIRYHLTAILNLVMKNKKTTQLQSEILGDPMAVATIVDLLEDKETIRLQALNVLVSLTSSPQEDLQKLVAFSGGFEKVLGIIDIGGYWGDDGAGLADCLRVVGNLLQKNVLTQNYFRETSCIRRLVPLLTLESSDTWLLTDEKAKAVAATLDIVFFLVTGTNPDISTNQSEICKHGILELVMTWALDRINSPHVRSKALFALGALLRHHTENRNIFSQKIIHIAREDTPQPTLHRLLTLAFHSSNVSEQISAAYAFTNFLHDNQESQLAIVTTLTPPPDSVQTSSRADAHAGSNSIGRQLLKSLQEGYKQPVTSWIASWILSCVLADNQDCKQVAQRIQLSLESPGETLLVLCMKLLRSNQSQVKERTDLQSQIASVGYLRLLSIWMFQFPSLVVEFLKTPENLTFLIDLINQPNANLHLQGMGALLLGFCFMFNENEDSDNMSTNRFALHGIICHRIGLDKFMGKINILRSSDAFVSAEKTEITSLDWSTLNYDYLLCDLDLIEFVKNSKDQLLRDLRSPNKRKADHIHKDQMKEKENEISLLKQKLKELEAKLQVDVAKQCEDDAKEATISSELQEALERIRMLEEELEEKEDALQSLSLAYNDLESHLSSMQDSNGVPISIPQPIIQSLEEDIQKIGKLENEKNFLSESLAKLQEQLDSIPNNVFVSSEVKVDESLELKEKEQEIEKLCVEMAKMKENLQQHVEAESKAQNLLSSMQKRYQETLCQVKEQNAKNQKLEKEKEEIELLFAQETESLQKQLQDVQSQLKNSLCVQSTTSNSLQDSNKIHATEEALKETQRKLNELQKDHEDLLIMFVQAQSGSQ